MRLTLRTLLAYRDRVLGTSELEDMHGRIQQSAMASNLVKRLESLSQRTNILAPPIEGKGLGADANSIAEYLDDTLKGDKVPELERICLESDVQLAELAQCHSLLSAALSTAVDVPASLRQRIVALSDEKERALALVRRQEEARAINDNESSGSVRARRQDKVDAKSGSRMRFRTDDAHDETEHAKQDRAAGTPVETSAGQPADGHKESGNGKARSKDRPLVTAQPVAAPMVTSGGDSIRPSGLDLEGSHLAHEVPEYLRGRSRDGWLGPAAILGLVCLLILLVWQSIGSWSSVRDMFVQAPRTDASNSSESTVPAVNADSGKPNSNSGLPKDSSNNASSQPVDSATSKPNASTQPNLSAPALASSAEATKPNIAQPPVTQDPLSNVPQVAQWIPDKADMKSVLLIQAGELPLHRLQAGDSIPSGSQLFVPSANRPKLQLTAGPQWQVCGTTHALLAVPDGGAALAPQVDLRLGRAVVTGTASSGAIVLATPAGTVRLSLTENASMAIELSYQPVAHGPVNNRAAYVPLLTCAALAGEPVVELGDKKLTIAVGSNLVIQAGQVLSQEAAEAPSWIDATFERPVDLQAASDMSDALNDGSLGEDLQKLAVHRRAETRALAAQTLSLLGNWDWVTQPKSSLSDTRDRTFWPVLVERTRQILAAHPENAAVLAASLEQLDAPTAQWRLMLWLGLDSAQLQTDGGKRLIASLESDALIERILAIQQLQRATGKDLGYRAGEPNRTIVGQWTRDLFGSKLPLLPAPKS